MKFYCKFIGYSNDDKLFSIICRVPKLGLNPLVVKKDQLVPGDLVISNIPINENNHENTLYEIEEKDLYRIQ